MQHAGSRREIMSDLRTELETLANEARAAYRALSVAAPDQKNLALKEAAKAIRAAKDTILAANKKDMDNAKDLSDAMRDRLLLNDARVEAMAKGIEQVAELADPVGKIYEAWD